MRLDSITPPGELSWKLARGVAIHRLHNLRRQCSANPLRTCMTWDDARRWLEQVGPRTQEADVALRPILEAAQATPDELWHDIMLFLFWRPLVICRRGLKRYDNDGDIAEGIPSATLDAEILWAFVTVLHRIDLVIRRERIGQKILNDVQHDVRLSDKKKRRALAAHDHLITANDDEDAQGVHDPGVLDVGCAAVELRHDTKWARAYLKNLVHRGRISEPDYLILIGCLLYGYSIEKMAAQLGMSIDATRKRKQRVMKYLQNRARKMSHGIDEAPLKGVEGRKPERRNHE